MNCDAPLLPGIFAGRGRIVAKGRAVGGPGCGWSATLLDRLRHIEVLIFANNDVVAARVDCVAAVDGNPSIALATNYLHTAHNSPAIEEAIVQAAFCQPVRLLIVQVGFTEQLARKKAGTIKTLQTRASGTAAGGGVRDNP